MCVDMGWGSHFRERGGGFTEGFTKRGVHKKGGSREPSEPPGYIRAWVYLPKVSICTVITAITDV